MTRKMLGDRRPTFLPPSFLLSYEDVSLGRSQAWSLCSDTSLWSRAMVMTVIMMIMGFGGGSSSSCEDPIVPTNCIETSRTTVCGVEAVGSREEYAVLALGHSWMTVAQAKLVHLGYYECWKGLREPSHTRMGSEAKPSPLGSFSPLVAAGRAIWAKPTYCRSRR